MEYISARSLRGGELIMGIRPANRGQLSLETDICYLEEGERVRCIRTVAHAASMRLTTLVVIEKSGLCSVECLHSARFPLRGPAKAIAAHITESMSLEVVDGPLLVVQRGVEVHVHDIGGPADQACPLLAVITLPAEAAAAEYKLSGTSCSAVLQGVCYPVLHWIDPRRRHLRLPIDVRALRGCTGAGAASPSLSPTEVDWASPVWTVADASDTNSFWSLQCGAASFHLSAQLPLVAHNPAAIGAICYSNVGDAGKRDPDAVYYTAIDEMQAVIVKVSSNQILCQRFLRSIVGDVRPGEASESISRIVHANPVEIGSSGFLLVELQSSFCIVVLSAADLSVLQVFHDIACWSLRPATHAAFPSMVVLPRRYSNDIFRSTNYYFSGVACGYCLEKEREIAHENSDMETRHFPSIIEFQSLLLSQSQFGVVNLCTSLTISPPDSICDKRVESFTLEESRPQKRKDAFGDSSEPGTTKKRKKKRRRVTDDAMGLQSLMSAIRAHIAHFREHEITMMSQLKEKLLILKRLSDAFSRSMRAGTPLRSMRLGPVFGHMLALFDGSSATAEAGTFCHQADILSSVDAIRLEDHYCSRTKLERRNAITVFVRIKNVVGSSVFGLQLRAHWGNKALRSRSGYIRELSAGESCWVVVTAVLDEEEVGMGPNSVDSSPPLITIGAAWRVVKRGCPETNCAFRIEHRQCEENRLNGCTLCFIAVQSAQFQQSSNIAAATHHHSTLSYSCRPHLVLEPVSAYCIGADEPMPCSALASGALRVASPAQTRLAKLSRINKSCIGCRDTEGDSFDLAALRQSLQRSGLRVDVAVVTGASLLTTTRFSLEHSSSLEYLHLQIGAIGRCLLILHGALDYTTSGCTSADEQHPALRVGLGPAALRCADRAEGLGEASRLVEWLHYDLGLKLSIQDSGNGIMKLSDYFKQQQNANSNAHNLLSISRGLGEALEKELQLMAWMYRRNAHRKWSHQQGAAASEGTTGVSDRVFPRGGIYSFHQCRIYGEDIRIVRSLLKARVMSDNVYSDVLVSLSGNLEP